MQPFPTATHTFLLPGPAGNLELMTTTPENDTGKVAVICHPHPLHAGTMQNKIVSTLARAFNNLGLRTVRFNFRGVGQSAGQYDHGNGETADLLAIVEWVKQVTPGAPLWLAGFSFGSYVAARAAAQVGAEQLVLIAPPATYPEFKDLPTWPCPCIVVQGDQDEVIDPATVFTWVANLNPPPDLIRLDGAGHFFHGRLVELREKLEAHLRSAAG